MALDDDLLSHGETPHYHRRYIVSLLSSGREQVVPTFYGRQAILLRSRFLLAQSSPSLIRYVIVALICAFRELSVHNSSSQIVWVLYGQASRAISIG